LSKEEGHVQNMLTQTNAAGIEKKNELRKITTTTKEVYVIGGY